MSIIFDIAVLAIVVLLILSGMRKGFIKSLVDFVGAIISVILASAVATALADFIYNGFVRQGIYDRIFSSLEKSDVSATISDTFGNLPDFFVVVLDGIGINETNLLNQAVGTQENISNVIVDAISPVFILLIQFFALIILFILFLIIIKALASLVTKIIDIPVIREINALLGGVFGFCFALILTWILIALSVFCIGLVNPEVSDIYIDLLSNSYIASIIYNFNPFGGLMSIQ